MIFTLGHSNRTQEVFLDLLRSHEIEVLADVRTVPRSRHVPHFNRDHLGKILSERGIDYRHLPRLGGLRHPRKESPNQGWRNPGFRGFADYMQEDGFWEGIAELEALARERRVALMCAEAVPWRCHRSLIADALLIGGIQALHIFSQTKVEPHTLTRFAVVRGGRIFYPAPSEDQTAP